MKKLYLLLVTCLSFLILVSGCTSESVKKKYTSYQDLNGEKTGVSIGTVFEKGSAEILPDSEIAYYNNVTEEIEDLKKGKIESFFIDFGLANQITKENSDLTYYTGDFLEFDYAVLFPKTEKGDAIRQAFDEFLNNDYADYNFEENYHFWLNTDEYEYFDYESLPSTNGTLNIACDNQSFPFVFVSNNKLTGIDIEMMYKFCEKQGLGLKITPYNFAGILAAVSTSKADLAIGGICYTDERAEQFNFSKHYLRLGTVLIVRKDSVESNYQKLSDLSNTTVSCVSGSIYDDLLIKYADNVTFQYFDSVTDEINALLQGKVDATLINSNLYDGIVKEHGNLRIIDTVFEDDIGYIFPKSETPGLLQTQLDSYITSLKQSGELYEICDAWDSGEYTTVDYSGLTGKNGTIRFAVSSSIGIPSNYIQDGKHSGLDIDIMVRFAKEYGYDIQFQDYGFSGVLAAITSGKADVGAANISVTKERMESMNFTQPYYIGYVYAITADKDAVEENRTLIEKFEDSFYKTFIQEDRYKLFLSGVYTTLLITLLSCVFGTLLGFMLYMIFRNSNKICTKLLNAYSWFITGLPTIVVLMIFYYVIFVKTGLSAEIISIIAFSILFSLTVFSILKTCFMAIEKGQFEAAYALGYSKSKTITKVIIPEIAPMFFPSYRGEIVSLIKATSIVGYIAVQDITKVSDIVRSRTYEAFFPLIAITIIYFALALGLDLIARLIENKINTKNRKIEDILKGVKTK